MMTMNDEEVDVDSSASCRPHQQSSSRCLLLLQRSLAIQLTRGPPPRVLNSSPQRQQHHRCDSDEHQHEQHPADEMWMYDKGYNLFQGFLEANSRCWWNIALVEATRQLRYKGHCAPGVLMVGGPACALEVLRAAWSRNVLRPPADHVITCLGDIEDCLVAPVAQGQFTPLPEALCWAILELSSQRQAATLDTLRSALRSAFPAMQRPSRDMVYDALAKLMQERKIYHTAQGYFVVSPETRRLRQQQQRAHHESGNGNGRSKQCHQALSEPATRLPTMLMSSDEAVALVHGEMHTLRDGEVTHQAVQTNLADVICGGNPNDKVLFARCRSVPSRLERRHSLRLWGSARRLHRSGSSRSLPRRPERSDTSSSAEYPSTDCSSPHSPTKKVGLLSRLFRRSARRGKNGPTLVGTFAAQYPPTEWFNPRVVHLHSVATQTRPASPSMMESGPESRSQASLRAWDDCESSIRSATLPRRHHHRRQPSVDSSSLLLANSTPRSSRRQRAGSGSGSGSPCSTLPLRSKCSSLSRCTSRASVLPAQSNSNGNANNSSNSSSNANSNNTRSSNSSPNRSARSTANPRQSQPSLRRHEGKSANSSPQHKLLQKSSSTHSSQSSSSGSRLSSSSSPLKVIQQQEAVAAPATTSQNSITLQVSTNLSPSQEQRAAVQSSLQSSVTLASNASSTTTISGSPGTKIYVHQNNSPMRSVITFENKPPQAPPPAAKTDKEQLCSDKDKKEASQPRHAPVKPERPSSLYACKDSATDSSFPSSDKENRPRALALEDQDALSGKLKLTNNRLNNSQAHLLDHPGGNADAMNNSRKLSLSLSKDALSYRNLLRQPNSKNNSSNPPSPTKSYEHDLGGSFNNVLYIENLDKPLPQTQQPQPQQQQTQQQQPQQQQGSEPNLEKSTDLLASYPSLSDMQVHFTSLAAQKILKGCPLNSVDTLVEVNMAAAASDKPNNCDLTVHTDFGLV